MWVTPGLRLSSVHKNKLYKRWTLSQTEEDESKYRKYKKIFVKVAARAQELYYKHMFDSTMNTVKKLYDNLNVVCSFKTKKSRNNVDKLVMDDQTLVDSYEISNGFNKYFSNIGQTLAKKFNKDSNMNFSYYLNNPKKTACFVNH